MSMAPSQVQRRRRWPTEAEWARRDAVEAIEAAIRHLEESIAALEGRRPTAPEPERTLIAETISRNALALAALEKALRLLSEAKHGRD